MEVQKLNSQPQCDIHLLMTILPLLFLLFSVFFCCCLLLPISSTYCDFIPPFYLGAHKR